MAENKKFETMRGTAEYPNLGREEIIKGKPSGNFSVNLILEGPALEKARADIEDYINDTFPAKKAAGVTRPFKKNKAGQTYLKFTTKTKDKAGDAKPVRIYDSKEVRCDHLAGRIGTGSTIRIKGSLFPTEFQGADFVKCFLDAVVVAKLVAYTPGSGMAPDTEAEEGEQGFSADEFGDAPADPQEDAPQAPSKAPPAAEGKPGTEADF